MSMGAVESGWAPYRRALRDREREAFDAVMKKARLHASASSFALDASPIETVFMSVLLEQEMELTDLRKRVEDLSRKIDGG
jgi:hypothetical protein